MPLRVGVIGANPNRSWARDSHIPALRSLENVELAAVAGHSGFPLVVTPLTGTVTGGQSVLTRLEQEACD